MSGERQKAMKRKNVARAWSGGEGISQARDQRFDPAVCCKQMVSRYCSICRRKNQSPKMCIPKTEERRKKLVDLMFATNEKTKEAIIDGTYNGKRICYSHAPGWNLVKCKHGSLDVNVQTTGSVLSSMAKAEVEEIKAEPHDDVLQQSQGSIHSASSIHVSKKELELAYEMIKAEPHDDELQQSQGAIHSISSIPVSEEVLDYEMMANRKAWNHLGAFTREEAVQLLGERMVSQKRRVKMKSGIRIVYYCNVQRSAGCRYEMSAIVPADPNEKVLVDDINEHTCGESAARKRRSRHTVSDLDRPLIKRSKDSETQLQSTSNITIPMTDVSIASFLERQLASSSTTPEQSTSLTGPELTSGSDGLALFLQMNEKFIENASSVFHNDLPWSTVECDVVDLTKIPDGTHTHIFHAKCLVSHFTYFVPLSSNTPAAVVEAARQLCFLYGPPQVLKFDTQYKENGLEKDLLSSFPSIQVAFHPEKKNHRGELVQRHEPGDIRLHVLGWMMERGYGCSWSTRLPEIQYTCNTKYYHDIDSTPMEKFFGGDSHNSLHGRTSQQHSEHTSTSHEAYSDCGTEEAQDLRSDTSGSPNILQMKRELP